MKKTFLLLLITNCCCYFLHAQEKKSLLSGTVVSSSNDLVTDASVLLFSGKDTLRSITDEKGKFSFRLDVGKEYGIQINRIGYLSYLDKKMVVEGADRVVTLVLLPTNEGMREVRVSTQKRLQSNIDVPIAVTAMSGAMLDNLNIRQYDELAQYVPGLQMQLQSPNNPSYVIRGITSDDGDTRTQNRVSVFQDGVSMSRSRGSVAELFDMERVEVVKGPQGTLFGRGAQIGAVHLIENKPVDYFTGSLQVGYGNYNQKIATGFINTPLSPKFSNRLSFYYNERDGFIQNEAGGRLNGRGVVALRDIIRYKAGAHTTADLILNYQKDFYPGTAFKSGTYAPPGGDTLAWTKSGLNGGDSLHIKRNVFSATLLVNHAFSNSLSLSSITGYRQYHSDENFDADGTLAPILNISELQWGKQFSQEFRLNYDNKKNFSGFLGTSFFYENAHEDLPFVTNEQALYPAAMSIISSGVAQQLVAAGLPSASVSQLIPLIFPSTPAVINGQPNYVQNLPNIAGILQAAGIPLAALPASVQQLVGAISGAALNTYHKEESHDYGKNYAYELFADGTYRLSKRWSLTAGLRGSYEQQKAGYQADASVQPSALAILMGNYPNLLWAPTNGRLNLVKNYWSYVGRLALGFAVNDNNKLYASISRGRRPGVIMMTASDTSLLQPEIVWSYEIGAKGRLFNGKLSYELATYYYDWNHFQSGAYQLYNGSLMYVSKDAGKAHSFGIETGLQYYINSVNSVFANWGFVDGKFNQKDEDGNVQEYAGNTFRLTPKNTFSAGWNLGIPLSGTQTLFFFRPSYSYKSKVYFTDDNRSNLSQPGYGIFNANMGIRWRVGNLRYEVSAFGKNIADRKFLIDAGNTGDAIGMPTYIAGNRGTFGILAKIDF